jgi:hypothetical protein
VTPVASRSISAPDTAMWTPVMAPVAALATKALPPATTSQHAAPRRRLPIGSDDLAFKSLDYAAAGGHAAVSVQHVVAARKDLWP